VPDCSLDELHDVIQIAMAWRNNHMHQFKVNGRYFGHAMHDELDLEVEDEDGLRLSQIFAGKKKQPIFYYYDFGDFWDYEITLDKKLKPESRIKYPRCVSGARACPPEGVGGPKGYAEFVEAITDSKHENYADMKRWAGGKFDAEQFLVKAVNKELRKDRDFAP
jgi:hypothetical protein